MPAASSADTASRLTARGSGANRLPRPVPSFVLWLRGDEAVAANCRRQCGIRELLSGPGACLGRLAPARAAHPLCEDRLQSLIGQWLERTNALNHLHLSDL